MTPDAIISDRFSKAVLDFFKKKNVDVSNLTYKVSEPFHVDGIYYIDFEFFGKDVIVQYSTRHGFGLSYQNLEDYTNAPDEKFSTEKACLQRLLDIYARVPLEHFTERFQNFVPKDKYKFEIVKLNKKATDGKYAFIVKLGRLQRCFYYYLGIGYLTEFTLKVSEELPEGKTPFKESEADHAMGYFSWVLAHKELPKPKKEVT